MKTVLTLNGGIDRDTHPLFVDSEGGDVIMRRNARVLSADGSRAGVNTSIKGMTEINANLPSGTNIVVGATEDAERDQIIFANWNSNKSHGIYKLKNDIVYELSTGSFWNFDVDTSDAGQVDAGHPVDMSVLGDYVYITDYWNPPRKVNIVDSLSGADSYDVQLAVRYPTDAPIVKFGSDTSKKTNKMLGKAFQFTYLYVYDDYTYSVLSPYSDVIVSPSVFNYDGTIVDSSLGNYVSISFNVGADSVREVVLMCREQNFGNWFVVKRYEKDGEDEFSDAYVDFYNDVARVSNPYPSSELFNSDVPRLAHSIETVKNKVVLGGVKKGYDAPEVDFSVAVEYEDVSLGNISTDLVNSDEIYLASYRVKWTIPTTLEEGAVITVSFNGTYLEEGNYDFDFSYSFAVSVGSGDTQTSILNAIAYNINQRGTEIVTNERTGHVLSVSAYLSGSDVGISFNGVASIPWLGVREYSYTGSFAYQTLASGANTYKAGSFYNVALVDKDDFSRTAGAVGTQIVYIPHSFERDFADAYKSAVLKFTINDSSAPSWSKKYAFAVTEAISFSGVYNMIIGGQVIATKVDDKNVLAINIPDNVSYEFVNGDYAIIETSNGSSLTGIQKTVLGTRTVVTNDADEDVAGFWLIIPDEGEAIEDTIGTILTVYRPKDTVENNLFFEDYNTYDVVGGVRQTLTGYIRTGDAWISKRWFVTSNVGKASTGITLDTGTSGTAEVGLNLGGGEYLLGTATFDTDYETTAKNFVLEYSAYFFQNGFVVGVDGAKIYITDNTDTYALLVPHINNLTGDLDGTTDPVADENTGILYPATVEDFYIDLSTALRSYSKGRVITEFDELGEIELQDVVWSNSYLDNTKINGVSMFTSLNRVQLDEKDGVIRKLILVGDVLKALQDNKETSLYIGKGQYRDGAGNLTTVQVGDFIGDTYPSVDDYGTRFPNSVAKDNRNLYYWDGDKGEVIRSSPNGQVPISAYKMKSEFFRIKRDLDASLRTDARGNSVVSHFDEKNNEFVITFSIRGATETWAFREGENKWVSYYDYSNAAGDAPQMFASVGNQVYSFLDNVWKHEDNSSHNMLYGEYKPLSVIVAPNILPREEKAFNAIETSSNRALKTTITTPVSNTHPYGQKSYLYEDTYRVRDSRYTSAIFKDILGVGGSEIISKIHSGDDMVGEYAQIEFTDAYNTECQLRVVTVSFSVNK